MPIDTFIAYVGVYPDVHAAEADYERVKDLHDKAGMLDAYDAAVIERRSDGKVKIVRKHETPTRVGGVLGGGVGPGNRVGSGALPAGGHRWGPAGGHDPWWFAPGRARWACRSRDEPR